MCLIGNSCEREKAPEDLPPEHFNRLIYFQSCEMNVAFEMAERQLGLDTDVVHLNLAMRVLFAQPDAIERWLKGEKVFSNPPTELRGMTLSRS